MSFLKTKYEENIISADLLITNCRFAASVHCSYYGCVQLMKHILISDLGKTESEIDSESEGFSFHTWLINKIKDELSVRSRSRRVFIDFGQTIAKLKKRRIKSDYRNEQIEEDISRRAQTEAQYIIKILITHFHI